MLTVDPVARITISGIRALEWFNIGLPNYLKLNQNTIGDKVDPLQFPDIIQEIEQVRQMKK